MYKRQKRNLEILYIDLEKKLNSIKTKINKKTEIKKKYKEQLYIVLDEHFFKNKKKINSSTNILKKIKEINNQIKELELKKENLKTEIKALDTEQQFVFKIIAIKKEI